jgi:hypothetical protein
MLPSPDFLSVHVISEAFRLISLQLSIAVITPNQPISLVSSDAWAYHIDAVMCSPLLPLVPILNYILP